MQARYYDPVIGRFYSNDPLGFRDIHSFNRYAYANNNPYRYTDPSGECVTPTLFAGCVVIVAGVITLWKVIKGVNEAGDAALKATDDAIQAQADSAVAFKSGNKDDIAKWAKSYGKAQASVNTSVQETGKLAADAAQITTLGVPSSTAELAVSTVGATNTILGAVKNKNKNKNKNKSFMWGSQKDHMKFKNTPWQQALDRMNENSAPEATGQ